MTTHCPTCLSGRIVVVVTAGRAGFCTACGARWGGREQAVTPASQAEGRGGVRVLSRRPEAGRPA